MAHPDITHVDLSMEDLESLREGGRHFAQNALDAINRDPSKASSSIGGGIIALAHALTQAESLTMDPDRALAPLVMYAAAALALEYPEVAQMMFDKPEKGNFREAIAAAVYAYGESLSTISTSMLASI